MLITEIFWQYEESSRKTVLVSNKKPILTDGFFIYGVVF